MTYEKKATKAKKKRPCSKTNNAYRSKVQSKIKDLVYADKTR